MELTWRLVQIVLLLTFIIHGDCGEDDKAKSLDGMHSPYIPDKTNLQSSSPLTDYVQYLAGTMPLVITVPHDGFVDLDSIPDRKAGCFIQGACVYHHDCGDFDFTRCKVSTIHEDNMKELAVRLREDILNMTGHAPHVIISKLSRDKVDVDMDIDKGTFGDAKATLAWQFYHEVIHKVKESLKGTPGLLLDLHGQHHILQRTELGYISSSDDLNKDDLEPEDSSIRALASRSSEAFSELIRGKLSLGGLLEGRGFSSLPSPSYPTPHNKPYVNNGYSIRVYGSRDSGEMDAILVSSANSFVTTDLMNVYANALAKSVIDFMKNGYDFKFTPLRIHTINRPSDTHMDKTKAKVAIVCSTFIGCFLVMGLIYIARNKIRKLRIHRYERFADEV